MINALKARSLYCFVGMLVLTACELWPGSVEQDTVITPTVTVQLTTPTHIFDQDKAMTETPEVVMNLPTDTPFPSATVQPSATPLPAGFGIVPDLRGLPLAEARTVALEAGYSYLFQDVLNLDVPSSTIIDQDPPAGSPMPLNEVIYLYRSFQALEMYAGGECQPLMITLPSGKLLYWVELEEGVSYNVRTDFSQGRTQVSDYRMYLLAEFDNKSQDSIDVKPLAPGRYVISLGPYEVSKTTLAQEGRIRAGCLWVTPDDLEP